MRQETQVAVRDGPGAAVYSRAGDFLFFIFIHGTGENLGGTDTPPVIASPRGITRPQLCLRT